MIRRTPTRNQQTRHQVEILLAARGDGFLSIPGSAVTTQMETSVYRLVRQGLAEYEFVFTEEVYGGLVRLTDKGREKADHYAAKQTDEAHRLQVKCG